MFGPVWLIIFVMPRWSFFLKKKNIIVIKNVAITIITNILCDNDGCNPFVSTPTVDVSEALCCLSNMNLIFVALCDIR